MKPERAQEILKQIQSAPFPWNEDTKKYFKPGEREEVCHYWDTLPRNSCFATALSRIAKGESMIFFEDEEVQHKELDLRITKRSFRRRDDNEDEVQISARAGNHGLDVYLMERRFDASQIEQQTQWFIEQEAKASVYFQKDPPRMPFEPWHGPIGINGKVFWYMHGHKVTFEQWSMFREGLYP